MTLPRLLDLTRLVSRLGRATLTGVDRVELAWLDHLLEGEARAGLPLFALVRTAWGFALLNSAGAAQIAQLARTGAPPGAPDLLARLSRRYDPLRGGAEALVRRLAIARSTVPGLARMLARHLPPETAYFNTGHANLTPRVLRARPGPVVVLLHDTIPLDHPEFTRPGIPVVFARKLQAVADRADLVVHTTRATRALNEAQLARRGRVPPGVVAPLGTEPPVPGPFSLPGLDRTRPWFVALGTIEPRKNHALLLDVWERLNADSTPPQLVIAGSRGWCNEAVFARLDARPPGVIEAAGLDDRAVSGLLAGSRGLLFPSLAEGFGLPPLEAAQLAVPVFAHDLAVTRELLGDYPVWLDGTDPAAWLAPLRAAIPDQNATSRAIPALPTWETHFQVVEHILG